MRKILFSLFCSISLCYSFSFAASSPYSYSSDFFVLPVSQADGDTFGTAQVTVSTSAVTLIDAAEPAVTYQQTYSGSTITYTASGDMNRSYRKRTVHNICGFAVFIGTNTTTLATTGFDLATGSTTAGSFYTTYDRGAIYGLATSSAGATGCVVTVIKETNSVP